MEEDKHLDGRHAIEEAMSEPSLIRTCSFILFTVTVTHQLARSCGIVPSVRKVRYQFIALVDGFL